MKFLSRTVGLFQAAGLTLYVCFFAVSANFFQQWAAAQGVQDSPPLGIILFLLAFIISAVVSGAIMLAYPIYLFFGGRKEDAIKIILWSLGWLAVFFTIFLAASALIFGKFF